MSKNVNNNSVLNFEEITTDTLIKDFPEIIKRNNSNLLSFINDIYDFGTNSLKVGINAIGDNDKSTHVRATTAQFNNLNVSDLTCTGKVAITNFSHNDLADRNDSSAHNISSISGLSDILNQIDSSISVIKGNEQSVIDRISKLENDYNALCDALNINNRVTTVDEGTTTYSLRRTVTDNNIDNEIVKVINQNTNSYTYPNSIYSNNIIDKCIYPYDRYDITNNVKFRYYKVEDEYYVKVNNQYKCALNNDIVGRKIELVIDKNTVNTDLYIKLSYNGSIYNYLKVAYNDIDLTRILLVCTKVDEYGPTWYVLNYSGNITFENIEK